jgi:hypothetical protein
MFHRVIRNPVSQSRVRFESGEDINMKSRTVLKKIEHHLKMWPKRTNKDSTTFVELRFNQPFEDVRVCVSNDFPNEKFTIFNKNFEMSNQFTEHVMNERTRS